MFFSMLQSTVEVLEISRRLQRCAAAQRRQPRKFSRRLRQLPRALDIFRVTDQSEIEILHFILRSFPQDSSACALLLEQLHLLSLYDGLVAELNDLCCPPCSFSIFSPTPTSNASTTWWNAPNTPRDAASGVCQGIAFRFL
jgi:hypothetical protein